MSAQTVTWTAVLPTLLVAASCLLCLLADLLLPSSTRLQRLPGSLALAGLGAAILSVGWLWGSTAGTFCISGSGELPTCSYVVDPVTLTFQAIVLVGTFLVVLLADDEVRAARIPTGEFHFLLLASAAGALMLAASRDLASIVVALEVLSLPAFALVGLRRDEARSSEAALTYFLVSVASVAVMLFGISLVYGVTGSLHLDRISAAFAEPAATTAPATVGVLLTLAGFLFKVAAVPFHFWAPDTYAGAPVSVAAYLSTVSKAGGLVGLLVLLTQGFDAWAWLWGPALAVVAALTMTLGNVAALRQTSAVRLLAWSSVAQAGYLLAPLAVAAQTPQLAADPGLLGRSLSASVGYLCIYVVVNLGAFGVVTVLAHGGVDRERPTVLLSGYAGLLRREPGGALALAFFLLCLAGLPPGIAGLFAKVVVVQAVVDGGLAWLAILVVLNTAIGLAYYLAWTARLFAPAQVAVSAGSARSHSAGQAHQERPLDVPLLSGIAIGIALVAALALSVLPQWVLQLLDVQAGALG